MNFEPQLELSFAQKIYGEMLTGVIGEISLFWVEVGLGWITLAGC